MQNRGLWVALLIACTSAIGTNVGNSFASVSGVCVFGSGVTMCLHDFHRIDFLIPKKYFSKQTSYTELSPFLVVFFAIS